MNIGIFSGNIYNDIINMMINIWDLKYIYKIFYFKFEFYSCKINLWISLTVVVMLDNDEIYMYCVIIKLSNLN